jgi:hypothetical protein
MIQAPNVSPDQFREMGPQERGLGVTSYSSEGSSPRYTADKPALDGRMRQESEGKRVAIDNTKV